MFVQYWSKVAAVNPDKRFWRLVTAGELVSTVRFIGELVLVLFFCWAFERVVLLIEPDPFFVFDDDVRGADFLARARCDMILFTWIEEMRQ